jgi:hypothetical protein
MEKESETMFVRIAVVLTTCLLPAALGLAEAPETVSGRIFLDVNANGRLDAGEAGLAGVRVTDGVTFVTTGSDGAYTISISDDRTFPVRATRVVSMSWPSGKWPTGRWWYRLSEITGAGSVNFPLRQDRQKLPFMYMHVTDSHGGFFGSQEPFAALVNSFGEVKFVFDTGDTSWSLDEKTKTRSLRGLAEAESKFNASFFHTIGNHDFSEWDKSPDLAGYGAFTRDMGPVRWSFDYAEVHFVGVDVMQVAQQATADWLERDLAGLKPAARIVMAYHYPNPEGCHKFLKLLRDYKVTLIHAGHNHAYQYWEDFAAPMVTAYGYRPPGTANAMVVSDGGIDIAFYCIGCRGNRYAHSRRCPMLWLDHILLSSIKSSFARLHKVENKPLGQQGEEFEVAENLALIQAQIAPGDAEKVSLKIGSGRTPLEIYYSGGRLSVAGVSVPFEIRRQDKTLNLAVFVQKDLLTVWADDYFFFEKPVKLAKAGRVAVSASGGKAVIRALSVQEVRADPGNKLNRYRCACAHGALRRSQ